VFVAEHLEELFRGKIDAYTGLAASKDRVIQYLSTPVARYDKIVFATHGLVGNDVPGIMEPVLVLTMVPEESR